MASFLAALDSHMEGLLTTDAGHNSNARKGGASSSSSSSLTSSSSSSSSASERVRLGLGGLQVNRILNGLWQIADMERRASGGCVDYELAHDDVEQYVKAGFTSFDMADHYGDAEIIMGEFDHGARGCAAKPECLTKWCPSSKPRFHTGGADDASQAEDLEDLARAREAEDAVELACARLKRPDGIDLLQYHTWDYLNPSWLAHLSALAALREAGRLREIGLCNFDADHVRVAVETGIPVVTNQVSYSLLDLRAAGAMTDECCRSGVKLLCFGTLAGGFLTSKWLGQPEPLPAEADDGDGDGDGDDANDGKKDAAAAAAAAAAGGGGGGGSSTDDANEGDSSAAAPPAKKRRRRLTTWSEMKYFRYIEQWGGWVLFQELLRALDGVAGKHGVSIANVATRFVLQQPCVAGVIIGARLGESEHRDDNRATLALTLDEADLAAISAVTDRSTKLPGDCGDEYRRPPFLTASGDLSHHIEALEPAFVATPQRQEAIAAAGGRRGSVTTAACVQSGTVYEEIAGYSRAVRRGNHIFVSGTTATLKGDQVVGGEDAYAQTVFVLDKIEATLKALGGTMADVVRTRVYIASMKDLEAVAKAHGRRFGAIRPANTLVQAGLVGDHRVDIEADAITLA